MRATRVGAAVVAAVVLSLSAGAAHAYWRATAPVQAAVIHSGDLAVTSQWVGGPPTWTALFPGQSTTPTTLRVTGAGAGTTLEWRMQMSLQVSAAFQTYVSMQAWAGACTTGTPLPAGGYPATGGLTPTQSVDVCVILTLAAGAPGSLSGQAVQPSFTVTATQRSS